LLFPGDFGEQLVDRPRVVDPHEAAEGSSPLPPNGALRGFREPQCATDANPHVPFGLRSHSSSYVAADVSVGQVPEELHE
jgi:hypothetical protein